eukprot:1854691-Rhodomonas_salina.1
MSGLPLVAIRRLHGPVEIGNRLRGGCRSGWLRGTSGLALGSDEVKSRHGPVCIRPWSSGGRDCT